MPRGGARKNAGRSKIIDAEKSIRVSYFLRPYEKEKMDLFFLELKEERKYKDIKEPRDRFVCEGCGKSCFAPTEYNKTAGKWLCFKCNN